MGTKNNPGAFDCYAKAEADEPMFVLLARDKHAPALVWLWATLRALDGEDEAVLAEARSCVGAMVSWAEAHGRTSEGQAALVGVLDLMRTVNAAIGGEGAALDPGAMEAALRFLAQPTAPAGEVQP